MRGCGLRQHLHAPMAQLGRVLASEFQVVCPWPLRELVDLKLWNDDMKNRVITNNGFLQAIHKTVWEIS